MLSYIILSTVCAQGVAKDIDFLYADSVDPDWMAYA